MQFPDRLVFTYIKPRSHKKKGLFEPGHKIKAIGRLAMPVNSNPTFSTTEVDDRVNALYYVRYTKEMEPILQSPQSWELTIALNPKLNKKAHTVNSADLDLRGKTLEIRI